MPASPPDPHARSASRVSPRARDAALARLRKLTRTTAALAVALAGVFAALAASSFHGRKLPQPDRQTVQPAARRRTLAAARQRPRRFVQVKPAAPPAPAPSPAPAPAPTAPAPAPAPAPPPAPTPAPPIVVSGGS